MDRNSPYDQEKSVNKSWDNSVQAVLFFGELILKAKSTGYW